MRRDFEYLRRGVCHLLAAFDVRTGEVMGEVVARRTGAALVAFLEGIARRHRGRRVIVIWDNLNIHHDGRDGRWTRFNERHGGRFEFVHTPTHASWVNQIELWFSVLERRVLRRGAFDHLGVIIASPGWSLLRNIVRGGVHAFRCFVDGADGTSAIDCDRDAVWLRRRIGAGSTVDSYVDPKKSDAISQRA
ncbi:MAG: transposase [Sandaracinaceae bacterium]|nr:transposase [Sandaracinaceae bacterium]